MVVSVDDKAKYVDLLARQDVFSLASFVRKLSEKEEERMHQFGISIHDEKRSNDLSIDNVHRRKKSR